MLRFGKETKPTRLFLKLYSLQNDLCIQRNTMENSLYSFRQDKDGLSKTLNWSESVAQKPRTENRLQILTFKSLKTDYLGANYIALKLWNLATTKSYQEQLITELLHLVSMMFKIGDVCFLL